MPEGPCLLSEAWWKWTATQLFSSQRLSPERRRDRSRVRAGLFSVGAPSCFFLRTLWQWLPGALGGAAMFALWASRVRVGASIPQARKPKKGRPRRGGGEERIVQIVFDSPGSADSRVPHLRGLEPRPFCGDVRWLLISSQIDHARGLLLLGLDALDWKRTRGRKGRGPPLPSCLAAPIEEQKAGGGRGRVSHAALSVPVSAEPRCECLRRVPTSMRSGRCTSSMPRSWISASSSAQTSGSPWLLS